MGVLQLLISCCAPPPHGIAGSERELGAAGSPAR